MSKKEQETVADIVAEMRNGPCNWLTSEGIPQQFHDNELFSEFADRIEAANQRGIEKINRLGVRVSDYEAVNAERLNLRRENARLREEAQRDIGTVSDDYGRLARELRAENARLREEAKRGCAQNCAWYHIYNCAVDALKPVLEVYERRHLYQTEGIYMAALESAVAEARRIYAEGSESEVKQ